MYLILLVFCIFIGVNFSYAKKVSYPSYWKSHLYEAKSSKRGEKYNLELIEFENSELSSKKLILFIPGYFQNAYSWDLLPEENISLINYINQNYDFHIFSLQPNGIGNSDYVRKSDIDDIAIDDIPNAIKFLKEKYEKEIYVVGHSNGAITLQASMAGLRRSKKGNYFDVSTSVQRQSQVKALGLSAGNVCLDDDRDNSLLKYMARLGVRIRYITQSLGWINARLLTWYLSPTNGPFGRVSAAYLKVWEFLYHIENVSTSARKALYDRTVEGTSGPTLKQYSEGVKSGCVKNTSGENYNLGLKNIKLPTYQMVYSLDPMAKPEQMKRDSFSKIGSLQKELIVYENQGHEDFMMSQKHHENFKWLLDKFLEL